MKAKTCQNKTDNQKNLEIVLLKDTYVLLICNCVTVWYLCMWYTYVISCQTICRSVCLFLSLSEFVSLSRSLHSHSRPLFVRWFVRSLYAFSLSSGVADSGIVFACSSLRADAAKTPLLLYAYNLSLMRCFCFRCRCCWHRRRGRDKATATAINKKRHAVASVYIAPPLPAPNLHQ